MSPAHGPTSSWQSETGRKVIPSVPNPFSQRACSLKEEGCWHAPAHCLCAQARPPVCNAVRPLTNICRPAVAEPLVQRQVPPQAGEQVDQHQEREQSSGEEQHPRRQQRNKRLRTDTSSTVSRWAVICMQHAIEPHIAQSSSSLAWDLMCCLGSGLTGGESLCKHPGREGHVSTSTAALPPTPVAHAVHRYRSGQLAVNNSAPGKAAHT